MEIEFKIADSGCWDVVSHVPNRSTGYPQVVVNGISSSAHRHVYREFVGDIPDGMVIRHTCDNKRCINPSHLLIGTHAENIADAVERGLIRRGEGVVLSKLKEAQVLQIFVSRKPTKELSQAFNVSARTVREIRAGGTWSWLTKHNAAARVRWAEMQKGE